MPKKSTKNEPKNVLEKEEYLPDVETEEEESVPKPVKPKRQLSPDALEKLKLARQKALQVRQANKELRDLERQADKKAKNDLKEQRKQELKKILRPADIEQLEEEPTSKREDIEREQQEPDEPNEPSLPRTKTVPHFDFFAKQESPFEEIGGFLVLKEPYRKRR